MSGAIRWQMCFFHEQQALWNAGFCRVGMDYGDCVVKDAFVIPADQLEAVAYDLHEATHGPALREGAGVAELQPYGCEGCVETAWQVFVALGIGERDE